MSAESQRTTSLRVTIRRPEVVHQTIEGEVVLIQLARGTYHSLRGSGAAIFELLDAGRDVSTAAKALAQRYDAPVVTLMEVVLGFARELIAAGLAVEAPPQPPADAGSATSADSTGSVFPDRGRRAPFEPPLLETFTDLADMLLLDPIHDVGEGGWPAKAPGAGIS